MKGGYNFDFILTELGASKHHFKGRERARMRVRIRDGFKCQSCGKIRSIRQAKKEGIKLFDVHHLDGQCGKNSRGYDSTKDISKLLTLCHKCHYNHHQFSQNYASKMGKPNFKRDTIIKRMNKDGSSMAHIGRKFGITRERVRQILL